MTPASLNGFRYGPLDAMPFASTRSHFGKNCCQQVCLRYTLNPPNCCIINAKLSPTCQGLHRAGHVPKKKNKKNQKRKKCCKNTKYLGFVGVVGHVKLQGRQWHCHRSASHCAWHGAKPNERARTHIKYTACGPLYEEQVVGIVLCLLISGWPKNKSKHTHWQCQSGSGPRFVYLWNFSVKSSHRRPNICCLYLPRMRHRRGQA